MNKVTLATIEEVAPLPGVTFQTMNVTDFSELPDVKGFTFFNDYTSFPTVTPCLLAHLANGDLISYPIEKLAYITVNEDSNVTAARSEAIEKCKACCLNQIKEHELDPFETEIFYAISGYAPFLTILEVRRIVDDLREYVINQ